MGAGLGLRDPQSPSRLRLYRRVCGSDALAETPTHTGLFMASGLHHSQGLLRRGDVTEHMPGQHMLSDGESTRH